MYLDNLIGNTPMIKINYSYKNKLQHLYAKLEYFNLTGSIKDRMAYYIIKNALCCNKLKKGQPIIEATSGNTGISFSAIGAYLGCPVHIFMPDWLSIERQKILSMYGANLHLISKQDGGFKRCIKEADLLSSQINGFRPNQFANNDNLLSHYNSTGVEIYQKLPHINIFVSGIGTGGTLMGIGKYLKEQNDTIKIHALEPSTLAILSFGISCGSHEIEGIGDDFVPDIIDRDLIDDIILISDSDAINMSKLLARKLGLGVGISSGANFLASVLSNKSDNQCVATVFPDDNKKYLSTKLSGPLDTSSLFVSNKIKLIDFEVV